MCGLGCPWVKLHLCGVEFLADLLILNSNGIDVILGMDWLTKHEGNIACSSRKVTLVNHNGIKVEFEPKGPKSDPMACNLSKQSVGDVPVIYEYPDVFPEELPGMPPDRDIEFVIDLLLRTAPISKRPYRMAVNELELLKE